ncbi:MAG: ComF family protein [Atopobiaceae bacterium]|jgi:ComF family protein
MTSTFLPDESWATREGASDALSLLSEGLKELVWPTRCLGCGQPGSLLCERCKTDLPWIDQRLACPVCGAPYGKLICTECEGGWESHAAICALDFGAKQHLASRMVKGLKDGHELRLASTMAQIMATALDQASHTPALDGQPRFDFMHTDGICFVPATFSAYARRGFDHMELIAQELSALTGIPMMDVLQRSSCKDQRTLGREERALNLSHAVSCQADVSGLCLCILDDVITTGASMRACSRALAERGATSVCCAFARVW